MEVVYTLFKMISSLSVNILYEISLVNKLFSFDLSNKIVILKDFEGISNEEFLDKKQVFLPQFDSYINVIFQINESYFLKNGDSKKKGDRHQEIVKYTKKILEEFIKKFTIKKFFKLFIAQEWNKYINRLQNLMYFFNVFMYINLQENDINNLSFFKNTNFYKNTNWYE